MLDTSEKKSTDDFYTYFTFISFIIQQINLFEYVFKIIDIFKIYALITIYLTDNEFHISTRNNSCILRWNMNEFVPWKYSFLYTV